MLKLTNRLINLAILGLAMTSSLVQAQTQEALDALIPVIAIIDLGGPDQGSLTREYNSFRATFPLRPICILELTGAGETFIPAGLARDSNAIIRTVNRDGGDAFQRSDWFDQCNLQASVGVGAVAINIDVSLPVVSASAEFFIQRVAAAFGTTPIEVTSQSNNNWLAPLNVLLLASNMPSSTPSRLPSISPSLSPSNSPSISPSDIPSRSPSKAPSISPSRVPSPTPSDPPSMVPSVSPSAAPSTSPSSAPSVASGNLATVTASLTMQFSPSDAILNMPFALTTEASAEIKRAMEDYWLNYINTQTTTQMFIGTTETFTEQTAVLTNSDTAVLVTGTMAAQFRNAITDAQLVTAANALAGSAIGTIPLLFYLWEGGTASEGGTAAELGEILSITITYA